MRPERLTPGRKLLVSGKLDASSGRPILPHPDHIVPAEQADRLPPIEPVWRLTAGLWPRAMAPAMAQALERLPALPEWHDPALLQARGLAGLRRGAARRLQAPAELPEPAPRRAWPMTSCWPIRWRCCWCAAGCGRGPAGR